MLTTVYDLSTETVERMPYPAKRGRWHSETSDVQYVVVKFIENAEKYWWNVWIVDFAGRGTIMRKFKTRDEAVDFAKNLADLLDETRLF